MDVVAVSVGCRCQKAGVACGEQCKCDEVRCVLRPAPEPESTTTEEQDGAHVSAYTVSSGNGTIPEGHCACAGDKIACGPKSRCTSRIIDIMSDARPTQPSASFLLQPFSQELLTKCN